MRLAKLGGLDTGQVAAALFGPVVLERFDWVLGQIKQVRGMLSSDGKPPARPPRRAGRFIGYPVTARAYPGFLVETTGFSGSAVNPTGGPPLNFTGKLTGLSSDAVVYGQPMRLEATATGEKGESWVIQGSFDHRTSPGQDIVTARGKGVHLADVKLSGGSLPERAVAKAADVALDANLQGFTLAAALRIDAKQVTFQFAQAGGGGAKQQAMRELFSGFDTVQLQATLSGTLRHPRVRVSSSIDQQFSQRMKELLGKRRAEAEANIRGQIEAQVQARRAEVEQSLQGQLAPLEAKARETEAKVQAFQEQLERRQAEAENAAKGKAQGKAEDLKKRLFKR
jgi:uncharacterized protein (TIGR03545 family)